MGVFGKGAARICAVVAAQSARDFSAQVLLALRETPTVELRLDWLGGDGERRKALNWLRRLRTKNAIFLATCRRRIAGGEFAGTAEEELFWLREAKEAGCTWCDLEVETLRELPGKTVESYELPRRVLLSIHDFRRTPPLPKRLNIARREGVDAVKVAAMSRNLTDSIRVLKLARDIRNVVAVPMGGIGLPARVLALRYGSALLYAPVAAATAPGQVGLHDLKKLYRAHELTPRTHVYGVIGDPIGHSLSPLLHNTGYVAAGKDAVFLPFLVENLREFLKVMGEFDVAGFSVTLPHKQRIFDYLDHCESLAEAIGAVNTVTVESNGKLTGSNTDYVGVLHALEGKFKLQGSRIVIFGAGGAARAAAFAVAKAGAEVVICARREAAAKELARAVHGSVLKRAALRKSKFDAIVNSTPVGMYPHPGSSPLDAGELNSKLVMDLIYRPMRTKLLRMAASRGIRTVSGVEMFLAQGIAQWERWMKSPAPKAAMRQAILKALKSDETRKQ
ncbi:MAG TPA: shikimate dehydrogenase [Verrucomicrobiae bacterium]|nr:shikimate dehydrogenase [Verrucomicrobiae bacterium]